VKSGNFTAFKRKRPLLVVEKAAWAFHVFLSGLPSGLRDKRKVSDA